MSNKQTTGIVSKNSIAYVRAIFECYANDETVVLLRDKDDTRIELTDVSKVIDPSDEKGWFKQQHQFRDDDATAQIAFTSGTEGEPKGVLLTHEALSDVTQRLNIIMEVDSSIREYVGIPANFSFGLGRFRAVAAAGGHSYLPANGFDPLEIRDMLSAGEINAVSAVPSLWRVLLKNKQIFGNEAGYLKWIEIGSQYMSRAEKEELVALFPNAKIAQHYGLTEASRSSFLRLDQTQGEHLESVGRAYGKTEFKISESGRICIRGPHVAKTLLKNGEYIANVDGENWFETSDLGQLIDGFLYYQGRADDLINCGGIKLSPDALEREIRQLLEIKEGIAVSAVNDEMTGHAVLVAYRDDININQNALVEAAFNVLKTFGINNRRVIKILQLKEFPLTSTNKVKRKDLAKLFDEQAESQTESIGNTDSHTYTMTDEELEIAQIWSEVLKIEHINPESNFYDLGGDSLSAIGALVAMETKGVPAHISKGMLQGMTVREIAGRMSGEGITTTTRHAIRSDSIKNTMTISIIRGVMVLLVIFAHWHQGLLEKIPGIDMKLFTSFAGPVLSMATPGFAIIYGVGAGYSLFPLLEKDPGRLKGIFRKTALFLFSGIFILAMIVFWASSLKLGNLTSFSTFTTSFYSVLTFYLLASLTLFYWFRLVKWSASPIMFSALMASLLYALHYFAVAKLAGLHTTGISELVKLAFTGKYAYFLMMSGAMIGVGIGITLSKLPLNRDSTMHYLMLGICFLMVGGAMWQYVYQLDPWNYWPIRDNYIWRWLFYSGVIVILLVLTSQILKTYDDAHALLRILLQSLSVIGMLAFPLFVLHEMVLPAKQILISLGAAGLVGFIVPISAFLLISVLMFRKLHNVSFK